MEVEIAVALDTNRGPRSSFWRKSRLAFQHAVRLVTRDRHFERIPQLLLG